MTTETGTPKMCYSVAEAAEALGVDPTTVYKWIHQLGLPARKIGGRRLIAVSELERWVLEQDD